VVDARRCPFQRIAQGSVEIEYQQIVHGLGPRVDAQLTMSVSSRANDSVPTLSQIQAA
jgi:hypothetical protein